MHCRVALAQSLVKEKSTSATELITSLPRASGDASDSPRIAASLGDSEPEKPKAPAVASRTPLHLSKLRKYADIPTVSPVSQIRAEDASGSLAVRIARFT